MSNKTYLIFSPKFGHNVIVLSQLYKRPRQGFDKLIFRVKGFEDEIRYAETYNDKLNKKLIAFSKNYTNTGNLDNSIKFSQFSEI